MHEIDPDFGRGSEPGGPSLARGGSGRSPKSQARSEVAPSFELQESPRLQNSAARAEFHSSHREPGANSPTSDKETGCRGPRWAAVPSAIRGSSPTDLCRRKRRKGPSAKAAHCRQPSPTLSLMLVRAMRRHIAMRMAGRQSGCVVRQCILRSRSPRPAGGRRSVVPRWRPLLEATASPATRRGHGRRPDGDHRAAPPAEPLSVNPCVGLAADAHERAEDSLSASATLRARAHRGTDAEAK